MSRDLLTVFIAVGVIVGFYLIWRYVYGKTLGVTV